MNPPSTIAIDGPAASGKTTLALALARHLGYLYFDTGVMYRAVTLAALKRGIDINDDDAVSSTARTISVDVLPPTVDDGRPCTVLLDGEDVTWAIREPEIDAQVSIPSMYRGVREALTIIQRQIAARGEVVMVGRDIGTVVLPDADLKIYLDASVEERARRRWEENHLHGTDGSLEAVLDAMKNRDKLDSERDIAPLRPADDAVVIDNTNLSIPEVIEQVIQLIEGR
ncbi:MAG: (d)CMP kinase [Anaerolineae bacterium]|nr:(d)CMP kinase [Anaerolineae bacterium]